MNDIVPSFLALEKRGLIAHGNSEKILPAYYDRHEKDESPRTTKKRQN
jgi:hypothetical protein